MNELKINELINEYIDEYLDPMKYCDWNINMYFSFKLKFSSRVKKRFPELTLVKFIKYIHFSTCYEKDVKIYISIVLKILEK